MQIESVDFFYLSMPTVLDIGDGSQDALLVRVAGEAHKGDYVNVALYHESIDKAQAVKLTKRVACVAGEVLRYERGRKVLKPMAT